MKTPENVRRTVESSPSTFDSVETTRPVDLSDVSNFLSGTKDGGGRILVTGRGGPEGGRGRSSP